MPIPEWELWACAHEMMRRHGPDAGTHAAMRADELTGKADLDGACASRIDALQSGGSGRPH